MHTEQTARRSAARRSAARLALGVAILLLVPLAAMQLTDQVAWGPLDFAVAGVLLFGTGLLYQAAARRAERVGGDVAYRIAAGLALASALFLVWSNLAVGLIGDEGNAANLMYIGVLAVGVVGAAVARLRPRGMAWALLAMAAAQGVIAAVALSLRLGAPASGPLEVVGVNAFFVALFVGAAALFREAAGPAAPPSTRPVV